MHQHKTKGWFLDQTIFLLYAAWVLRGSRTDRPSVRDDSLIKRDKARSSRNRSSNLTTKYKYKTNTKQTPQPKTQTTQEQLPFFSCFCVIAKRARSYVGRSQSYPVEEIESNNQSKKSEGLKHKQHNAKPKTGRRFQVGDLSETTNITGKSYVGTLRRSVSISMLQEVRRLECSYRFTMKRRPCFFFLAGCCMAQRHRCPGGRPSVSYNGVKMSQKHWIYSSK